MKKLFSILLILVFSAGAIAAETAKDGKIYGKGISLKQKTKISVILADPEKYVDQRVLVEGRVVDVCKKRGCWMKIASDKEFQTIRVKVKDGEIVFPMEAKGKLGLVEGIMQKIVLSKKQTIARMKHHAKEHGEKFDSSSVKEGLVIYQIKGLGAEIYK